jgi:hypothetical protein
MEIVLRPEEVQKVRREVAQAEISFSHLDDDLIDHICCDVEEEMEGGLAFDKAWAIVRSKIGLGGLERIQEDTLYLIHKKYRIMKNAMKISGLLAPLLLVSGTIFRMEHLPAAGILLSAGFILLSFVFLPSALYVSFTEVSNRSKKWTYLMGFLGTFFTSMGFLFKIQHWPYTGVILLIGFSLIILVFLPMVMVNRTRVKSDPVPVHTYIIALVGLIFSLSGFLFKAMHWSGSGALMITGLVMLVFVAFPVYVVKTSRDNLYVTGSFVFVVMALIWYVVPVTLMSLNSAVPYLESAAVDNRMMEADLERIETRNQELIGRLQGDSISIGLDRTADNLRQLLDNWKQALLLGYRVKPDSTYNELLQQFETLTQRVSVDPSYQKEIAQYLSYPPELRGDLRGISQNRLIFLRQGIGLAEQAALLERAKDTGTTQQMN